MRLPALLAASGLALLASPSALACGVSGSGAPAGICDASDVLDAKAAAARDRVGVSYGFTSSVLFFSDGTRQPTERQTVAASYEHPMKGRWTLEVAAGSLLGGHVGAATFTPGVLGTVSLSHLIVPPRGRYVAPFVLLSFTLAGVWARAAGADYAAFDIDVALAAGATLPNAKAYKITPFVVARAFGGPVFYRGAVGTDAYHYAVGPGLALALARGRVGLSVGSSVFGEKDIKGGVTVAF